MDAKTTRPLLASTVLRPRLFRRLDDCAGKPLTWVCGPPGAGKSTLVSSYVAARRLRALWYQIDDDDEDLATFFYFISRAIRRTRRPLPSLTSESRRAHLAFSRQFFRELFTPLRAPFALVVDNYQELSASAPLHEVLKIALDVLPPHGRMIAISRNAPAAAFARYRAHQLMDVVDDDELRFTERETGRLARVVAPGRWSLDAVKSLHASAAGWGAGVVLLAKQHAKVLRSSPRRDSTNETLFDYFAGEILNRAPADDQTFLTETAFLPYVTPAMATTLTSRSDAEVVLSTLHRQNLFTARRADKEDVFEYHPLFRSFLMSHAKRTYAEPRLKDVRCRAATIAETEGLTEAAATLLCDAQDWPQLAALTGRHAATLIAQGRTDTVERWVKAMPAAIVDDWPWVLYWRGVCWFAWRHAESQQSLKQAFVRFRERGDAAGAFLSWSTLIVAFEGAGEAGAIDEWARQFDVLISDYGMFPSDAIESRVAAAMLSVMVHRQPARADGEQWARRALDLARQQPDSSFYAIVAFNWFVYHFQLGRQTTALEILEDMRALMRARATPPEAVMAAAMTVVWAEALTANPGYAQSAADVLERGETPGVLHAARFGVVCGALIGSLSDGDLDAASRWALEFESSLPTLGIGYQSFYYKFIVRSALTRHDYERAYAYREQMLRCADAAGWYLDIVAAYLLSAQVLALRGHVSDALQHAQHAAELARTAPSSFAEFMVLLTVAELRLRGAQDEEGVSTLRRAMGLGRRGGFVNTPVWQPDSMSYLCARALDEGIETSYVRMLIAKRHLSPPESPRPGAGWPWPVRIHALGRLEIVINDEPVTFQGKVPRKPLELLRAIIALGVRGRARESRIIDALWPDAEGDAGRFALTTTLHRLRRLLGHEGAVLRQDEQIGFDARLCWVDALELQTILDRAEALRTESDEQWRDLDHYVASVVMLYRGPLVGTDGAPAWARPFDSALRRRLVRHVIRLASHRQQRKQWEIAANLYERALAIEPSDGTALAALSTCRVERLRGEESGV